MLRGGAHGNPAAALLEVLSRRPCGATQHHAAAPLKPVGAATVARTPGKPARARAWKALGAVVVVLLLALLLGLGDVRQAISLVPRFPRSKVLAVAALYAGYEVVRLGQWLFLLRRAGVLAAPSAAIVSFSGAEATKSLPGGVYVQNYLLRQTQGTPFAYSSAITTVIIWMEVVVALGTLAVLDLPAWRWLRPACVSLLAGIVVLTALLSRVGASNVHSRIDRSPFPVRALYGASAGAPNLLSWRDRSAVGRWVASQLHDFRDGARSILTPSTLAVGLAMSWCYLMFAAVAFTLILRGLGASGAVVREGVVAYMAGLAAAIIVPIPIDVGVAELGGMGALLALGEGRGAALAAVLLNRVTGLGVAMALTFVVGVTLRHRWRSLLAPND